MADLHTLGPWEVAETYADPGEAPETVIRGLDGRAAVAVALDFPNASGMRQANAHLIATAPDMLAVLEMVQRVIEDHQRGAKGAEFRHSYTEWTTAVTAVIATARGIAIAEPATDAVH